MKLLFVLLLVFSAISMNLVYGKNLKGQATLGKKTNTKVELKTSTEGGMKLTTEMDLETRMNMGMDSQTEGRTWFSPSDQNCINACNAQLSNGYYLLTLSNTNWACGYFYPYYDAKIYGYQIFYYTTTVC